MWGEHSLGPQAASSFKRKGVGTNTSLSECPVGSGHCGGEPLPDQGPLQALGGNSSETAGRQETRGAELSGIRGGSRVGTAVPRHVSWELSSWRDRGDWVSSDGGKPLRMDFLQWAEEVCRQEGYEGSRKGHLLRRRHVGYFPFCCFLADIFLQISVCKMGTLFFIYLPLRHHLLLIF